MLYYVREPYIQCASTEFEALVCFEFTVYVVVTCHVRALLHVQQQQADVSDFLLLLLFRFLFPKIQTSVQKNMLITF